MANEVNINPGHGKAGRHPTREFLDRLTGHDDPGFFGKMFPELRPLAYDDAELDDLAREMDDSLPGATSGENNKVPAGFTYLGQFIDHDISLDLTSFGDKESDPEAVENFRTPALDLDSIYGLGPDGSRHLYARNPPGFEGKTPGPKFLLSETVLGGPGDLTEVFSNDLPRNPEGFALIGDHRNDENVAVAQTHLAMLKFHNKVCDKLIAEGRPAELIFAEARQLVTWHYQWMVLHDFVERITEKGIVAKILDQGRRFYRFKKFPYMPVEFSVAAYRLGHSMVRETYSYNRVFTEGGPGKAATLGQFFTFSGLSGVIAGRLAGEIPGFHVESLPSNWIIDWRRFFEVLPKNPADVPLNFSRTLDPFIVNPLHKLPGESEPRKMNLAFRNLKRGVLLGLPSGQDVARAMHIKDPLRPEEIATGIDGKAAEKHDMHKQTPLWYYILKEAEQRGKGKKLGPVGATLVAEVFIGLVHGDRRSYLWLKGKNWKPTLPSKKSGEFTMADLLRFVGDISPIDHVTTV